MANVWKVGSRWSESGIKESCIVSVFRRNNVVFVGNTENISAVKAGDYLAIADGYTIVSVAKAIKDAEPIENMEIKWSLNEKEKERLNGFEEHSIGVKVKIVDLKPDNNEQLYYEMRGSFCQIQQEDLRRKVIEKFEYQGKKFSIQSYTCTLISEQNEQNCNVKAVLDSKTKYIIPVYQRSYSWSETELEPFINDIFRGFWGVEKDIKNQEPMFIGTMQLSEKKFIDKHEYEQHIIDGQQRLSTFVVLLKLLSLQFPDNEKIKNIFSKIQIETLVTDEQQKYLTHFLNLSVIDENESKQNPYLRNACIINNLYHLNIATEDSDNMFDFQVSDFIDYITTQVYFVVIETYAGLSKTLQIFNAINTTGLDLNGGDIFKMRMYEYLTSEKHEDSTDTFNKITKIYNLIDEKNKDNGYNVTNIHEILGIYKDYLISKYDLPVVLFDYSTDTFFERMFDSLLNINQWEHFKNTKEKKVEPKLSEISDIIMLRYEYKWEDLENISQESMYALNSVRHRSRYGKYWNIIYMLLYVQRNMPCEERNKNCELFLISLNKLLFIFSIIYDKAVNDMHSFMRNLKKQIVSNSLESLTSLKEKIISVNKNRIAEVLNDNIAYNARKKNLICLLSAFLNEIIIDTNNKNIKKILFETGFDIEHIHANANEDETIEITEVLQNCIGNLVMLESEINRSIQNKSFEEKKIEYRKSKYHSIMLIAQKAKWTEEEIIERKENEVSKILKYLYDLA